MGRGKQIAVLVLIAVMVAACVYLGIQIKNRPEPSGEEPVYQGSYRETKIALPVINEEQGEEYLQLLRGMDGKPELFTIILNEDRTLVQGYKKYVLNDEKKWDEAEDDWMALEYFSDTPQAIRLMSYAETGTLYLVLHNIAAVVPEADEVVRVTTSGSVEHVGVRGLYKTDAESRPIQIEKMFISNNMICITDKLGDSYAYSLVTGELYASGKNGAAGSLASDGSHLYMLSQDRNAVIPYRISDGKPDAERRLWDRAAAPEDDAGKYELPDYQLLSHEGTLYLSCQDGIFSFDASSSEWKQLLSGMDCIFGRPSVVQQNFIAADGNLYMFGRDVLGNSCCAMYDTRTEEEDAALSRTDFRISSYSRNPIIIETAVVFQHSNPSLRVIYEPALDSDPSLTPEEYRLQIQKAILDGTAADILVCDQLDYQSYIDSGFFENISDLMKPLYTAADLYGNVTNAMAQTKIFVTPAKFHVFLNYGSEKLLENMGTLSDLSAYSERSKAPALGSVTPEELARLLSSFYEEEYVPSQEIDAEALLAALNQIRLSARLSASPAAEDGATQEPANGDTQQSGNSSEKYTSNPGIARIGSADEFKELLNALETSGLKFSGAQGRFSPCNIVGINSRSGNSKAAREFIRTMYSTDVQQTNVGDGIPMQKSVILNWNPDIFTEGDLERFSACLETLDTVYNENSELYAAFLSILPALFSDEITAEDAVQRILNYIPEDISR
ncbi:MAG: hypothetical protein K2N94_15150 [Lachnospiraceae bacterium]|nr:hypothetical protein [Lachnospiraceae bacterium]